MSNDLLNHTHRVMQNKSFGVWNEQMNISIALEMKIIALELR